MSATEICDCSQVTKLDIPPLLMLELVSNETPVQIRDVQNFNIG